MVSGGDLITNLKHTVETSELTKRIEVVGKESEPLKLWEAYQRISTRSVYVRGKIHNGNGTLRLSRADYSRNVGKCQPILMQMVTPHPKPLCSPWPAICLLS